MFNLSLSDLLAKAALAFCFLGFGVWEIISPRLWTAYLPSYLQNVYPLFLVQAHGVALTAVALGVLSGFWPKVFWGLATLMLLNITLEMFLQDGYTEVFIRDGALLLFAAALLAKTFETRKA